VGEKRKRGEKKARRITSEVRLLEKAREKPVGPTQ
jgi:hypothetical protein